MVSIGGFDHDYDDDDDVSAVYVMMTSSDDVDITFLRWNAVCKIFVCGAVPAENIEHDV